MSQVVCLLNSTGKIRINIFIGILVGVLISFCLINCGPKLPVIRAWRPWIRTMGSQNDFIPDSKIKVEVKGKTVPLLGNESLIQDKIYNMTKYLMERRGYSVLSDSSDFILKIEYNTISHDETEFSSYYYTNNSSRNASIGASTTGLGVSVAGAVAAIATKSSSVLDQHISTSIFYIHTVSAEVYNNRNICIWKSESTWKSINLDINDNILFALQLMYSDLPYDNHNAPEIAEVKNDHVINYYKLTVEDLWFSCPALPYMITFPKILNRNSNNNKVPIESPSVFIHRCMDKNNRNAFAAFVDLVQTAEYAVPSGSGSWNNPLNELLWKKVTLGGKYRFGTNKTPINILVNLKGEEYGYVVDRCLVVSDSEYAEFQQKLTDWQKVLQDYYDIYEK